MAISIKGFIKNTLLDWEGKIASVIFTPGCNFRCPYCHSPHLVYAPEELETIHVEEVMEFLRANREWVDGLAITGGEPTIQSDLIEFLEMLKDEGIPAKLDTNGSRPDVLETVMSGKLVDYVAMDVKAPPGKYELAAGLPVDTKAIARSIRLLNDGRIDCEFRTTICPVLLDGNDIVEIARWIKGARLYILQNFRGGNCLYPKINTVRPLRPEQLREYANKAAGYVRECRVRSENTAAADTCTPAHNCAEHPAKQ